MVRAIPRDGTGYHPSSTPTLPPGETSIRPRHLIQRISVKNKQLRREIPLSRIRQQGHHRFCSGNLGRTTHVLHRQPLRKIFPPAIPRWMRSSCPARTASSSGHLVHYRASAAGRKKCVMPGTREHTRLTRRPCRFSQPHDFGLCLFKARATLQVPPVPLPQ